MRYRARVLCGLLTLAGCGDAALDASEFPQAGLYTPGSLLGYQPPPDAGRGDGGAGLTPEEQRELEDSIASAGKENRCVGQEGAEGVPGMLTASFQSASYGGFYAPKNCGAAWIEDEAGMYVATPLVWAQIRVRNLFVWDARRCRADWPPDVVSSATLTQHQAHELVWDGMSHAGTRVPNGTYVLNIEVTEDEFNYGRRAEYPFVWGESAFGLTPGDEESVKDLRIDFTPMP
jgi:hypothetical protein